MKSHKLTFQQTGIVAIGQAVCVGIMLIIFYVIGQFDRKVLLGGICGGALAVANFFFLALSADMAISKAENKDVKGGQAAVQLSYGVRMIALFVILFILVKSGLCNVITAVLPLVFTRPILTVAELFRKQGESKA